METDAGKLKKKNKVQRFFWRTEDSLTAHELLSQIKNIVVDHPGNDTHDYEGVCELTTVQYI